MFTQLLGADIPLNIDWLQILLHLLNFAILSLGLYLLLYKPVKRFMEKRKAHYKKLSDEADEKLKQADRLEAEYKKRLADADAEIAERKAGILQETEDATVVRLSQARAQCDRMLREATEQAGIERDKILSSANEAIAEAAILAAEKLLNTRAQDVYDTFIDAADGERAK